MREIKFRAWFTEGKHKTMSGQKCSLQEDRTLLEFLQAIEDVKEEHGYEYILMQFTGLKDKNGKEIYEGDIVRSGEIVCEIIWDETWCAFRAKRGLSLTERINCYVWEIIGNIHETPELLNPNERRRV